MDIKVEKYKDNILNEIHFLKLKIDGIEPDYPQQKKAENESSNADMYGNMFRLIEETLPNGSEFSDNNDQDSFDSRAEATEEIMYPTNIVKFSLQAMLDNLKDNILDTRKSACTISQIKKLVNKLVDIELLDPNNFKGDAEYISGRLVELSADVLRYDLHTEDDEYDGKKDEYDEEFTQPTIYNSDKTRMNDENVDSFEKIIRTKQDYFTDMIKSMIQGEAENHVKNIVESLKNC